MKIIEGTVANVPPQGGRKHPEQQYIPIDTTQILFICGGTFNDLENIIKKRLGHQMIGFTAEQQPVKATSIQTAEIVRQVTPEDLVHVGMIPELVGRLPIAAALAPLGENDLVRILTEPKNALVKQYGKFFEMAQARLEFSPEALLAIAKKALQRDTGARALRAVTEELMLDLMYELPDHEPNCKYVIDENIVLGKTPLYTARKQPKKKKETA